MSEDEAVHRRLWDLCIAAGIRFVVHSPADDYDPGDAAESFSPGLREHPTPTIHVWRENAAKCDDVVRETIIIAHEHGHYLAWKYGIESDDMHEAREKGREDYDGEYGGQTREDVHLVLGDEELAWAFARITLARLQGFGNWAAFEQQREQSLGSYSFSVRQGRFSKPSAKKG
jgi:hypothetical protein